ncbi:hypothetical protein ES288_D12G130400v1 [Gossypium darwinii]|uniref:Endonuclease/exonuclease/phosphatase domain-containing protein n=1 Tax=Gossypium darwinii TaxID=34276 RepID=A0A5D2A7R1_GOSDA|nr:hypothetical protein ES288_D12G130400v1 [Gossypium darwinii]
MKFLCWNYRGLGNSAKIRELKQLIAVNNPDVIFLSETKMSANDFRRVQNNCRLQNGLAVNSEGRSGGLTLMWRDGMNVSIQNFSKHHIDSKVRLDDNKTIRVTGFYGHANPNFRRSSWDILRRVGESVREEWVVGGDFNAILNDAEKEGGRRGVRVQMNEFKEVMDEMALVDIKPDSGWFTWVNNRNEGSLIKERLDRFLTSVEVVENFPFIATKVVRQTQSDHDAIILDLLGRKLKDYPKDKRLCFKFDVCWAGDEEAKNVIERAWNRDDTEYGEKLERVRSALGPWQCQKFGKMKSEMRKLEKQIESIIDSASRVDSGKKLKEARRRLNFLYAREESYWAQRSRSRWLREGDQNTRYFHAKATGRLKKNNIERIKDVEGNWVTNSKDICKVAKDYFVSLFRANGQNVEIQEMGYMTECVTRETNEWLNMTYTEEEVLLAIKQMNPNKAPGIDGLSGNFFKHHWEIVGKDTIQTCLDVLNGEKDISSLNDTMIILIPKIRDPCEITNYRPISLCRFVYKIISKDDTRQYPNSA